ncbi:MAG: hypothetical protein J6A52_04160 [Bacilli bacterium]|nr:hypothetical protein [Bacilli bacterium]
MILFRIKDKSYFTDRFPKTIKFVEKSLTLYKDVSMVEIEKMIVNDKVVIFPISSCYYTDEVKRYLDLGFKPYFVRTMDFKEIKKELYK